MTEEIVVNRRVFLIGLVITILISTTLSVVLSQFVLPEGLMRKSWRRVEVFSGNSDGTTEVFHIGGEHFRLIWNVVANISGEVDFGLYVYPEGETHPFGWRGTDLNLERADFLNRENSWLNGIEYIPSTGAFYIVIVARYVPLWEVIVEEYR